MPRLTSAEAAVYLAHRWFVSNYPAYVVYNAGVERIKMKKRRLLSMFVLLLITALAAQSCRSSKKEEPFTSITPIQSAVSATPSAYPEGDIDQIIKALVLSKMDATFGEDISVSVRHYHKDSSSTEWIRFDVFAMFATPVPLPPDFGILKRTPGGAWELVAGVGTAFLTCDLPADVAAALAFAVCQPDTFATASAASGQDVDKAIRDFVLSTVGPNINDVRIDRKTYYTDLSGTQWVEWHLYPLPEQVTDPAYGFMKRIPGSNWQAVAGPGTACVECRLPEDIQNAFGRVCDCQE